MREMVLRLPQCFYLPIKKPLVATSEFSLLTIRRHSATKKHLLPCPQGDMSGLRKEKKEKLQF